MPKSPPLSYRPWAASTARSSKAGPESASGQWRQGSCHSCLSVQLWPREKRGESDHAPGSTHGLSLAPLCLLLLNGERLISQDGVSLPPPALVVPFAAHIEATSVSSGGGDFLLPMWGGVEAVSTSPFPSTYTVPSTPGYLNPEPPSLNPSISDMYVSGYLTLFLSLFSFLSGGLCLSGLSLALAFMGRGGGRCLQPLWS